MTHIRFIRPHNKYGVCYQSCFSVIYYISTILNEMILLWRDTVLVPVIPVLLFKTEDNNYSTYKCPEQVYWATWKQSLPYCESCAIL